MTKKYSLLLLLMVLAIVAASCSAKEAVKPSEESVKASKALGLLQDMDRAYKAMDLKGVTAPVSTDFKSGLSEFETSVRKDIETFSAVNLDINIERVEESGDQVRIATHWYGKWQDKDVKETEGRGNAVFVFRDSAEMKLVEVLGDSPFGVVR